VGQFKIGSVTGFGVRTMLLSTRPIAALRSTLPAAIRIMRRVSSASTSAFGGDGAGLLPNLRRSRACAEISCASLIDLIDLHRSDTVKEFFLCSPVETLQKPSAVNSRMAGAQTVREIPPTLIKSSWLIAALPPPREHSIMIRSRTRREDRRNTWYAGLVAISASMGGDAAFFIIAILSLLFSAAIALSIFRRRSNPK
jgi:hypothetical protein